MTFSLLAKDSDTGAIGGAAATGSLCVGGWVLRGRLGAGMSASQGAAPSTFWGEDVLDAMGEGIDAGTAVTRVTGPDKGRDWRQLSALDMAGRAAAFTGIRNTPEMHSRIFDGGVAAGNMLASKEVVEVLADAFQGAAGSFDKRLLSALRAAERAGSDMRGLYSAALLVLRPDHAPLTLRIDLHDSDPIGALEILHGRATVGDYAEWARQVPCPKDPTRVLS
ncbi:MAG: fimbrial assembly protein FimA [Rhodobacteraceae bacterium]|nr:fimbrial assembly protein FimA [Paracoccaceae bacterium]